jgi:hypothetical protein
MVEWRGFATRRRDPDRRHTVRLAEIGKRAGRDPTAGP